MGSALDIARKDLRQKLRDRSAVMIAIVAPFALAALFSMILGGLGGDFHAHWAYVDLDGGEIAAELPAGPLATMSSQGILDVERYADADAARAAVAAGDVDAAIVVPAGFSDASTSGAAAAVQLIVDPDAAISGQVARSVLAGFASQVDAVRVSVATALIAAGQLPDAASASELAAQAAATASPVTVGQVPAADRRADNATYYAAAMAIFFIFMAAQFGIISVHAERRAGTLARMLAAPLRWWSIVAGKLVVSMVMAVVSMSIIVVGTSLLLGAHWGDPLGVGTLVLAAALAATGVSLLAVAFTRTEEQASSAVAMVSITLGIVGGAFFPTGQGPELLAQLSRFTPHAWFLDGVNVLSTGSGAAAVLAPVSVLAAIGLIAGGLGLLGARRMVLR